MPLFVERDEYDFFLRSVKFCDVIDKYYSLLGLDYSEVEAYKNENELFNYVFAHQAAYGSLAESFMRYKICNMQKLYNNLALQCKSSSNYTAAIGAHLGIDTMFKRDRLVSDSPKLSLTFNAYGQPVLMWKEGLFDSIEIWKDWGRGRGYEKFYTGCGGEYSDKSALPRDRCEVWKYTAIYVFKNEMIGNWSDECEAIVHNPTY